jgi:putative transposase
MKRTITIRIKPEYPDKLLETMEQYSFLYKRHTDWAIENKSYSKQRAHEDLYEVCRKDFSAMPSAFVQCARDNALESVRANKFRVTTPKRYATIRYDKRTVTLRGQQLTFSTIDKRQKVILVIPEYFKPVFNTWKFTGLQLSYKGKEFWAHLNYETDPPVIQEGVVLGVDRGVLNIVATSQGELVSGKAVRKNRRKHLHNRKTLQAKSTRSAKRRLIALSGSEKRFSKQVSHVVSKWLVAKDASVIVLEDLSKNKKRKGKHSNKRISDWGFYQLEMFLQYKAEARGKTIAFVDARYTSQKCSCCGNTAKTSRNAGRYNCPICGFSEHADINAAKNIRDSYLLSTLASRAGSSQ